MSNFHSQVCGRCEHFVTSHSSGVCQNCRTVSCATCEQSFIWVRRETKYCHLHRRPSLRDPARYQAMVAAKGKLPVSE